MTFNPCIVVPVYDHADGARTLIGRLVPLGIPVICVNDGSAAAHTQALRQLAATYDWVRVVEHDENQGKGAAVQSGLRAAHESGFSHALQIDADGQHDSGDIPKFLAQAKEDPGAVITGQPVYDASVPRGRLMARYLTHVWVWIETLSFSIRDSMCGFRVYPLAPVIAILDRSRPGRRMDFDPEILVRLSWTGTPIISIPTRVIYPEGGQSHFRLFQDNVLITLMHVRLVFGMLWRLPWLIGRKLMPQGRPRGRRKGRLDEC